MVPKAQLIVYYMKDGEIISDTIDIEFGEELHNFVSYILAIVFFRILIIHQL